MCEGRVLGGTCGLRHTSQYFIPTLTSSLGFCFVDRVSMHSLGFAWNSQSKMGWPGTDSDTPASVSQILGLWTTPGLAGTTNF